MFVSLSTLICPTCGVEAIPRIERGTGPHWGTYVCGHCGRFLRWARKPREVCMSPSVNRCTLLGQIGRSGVEVSYHGQGTPRAVFMMVLSELGSDGKTHQLWLPCEVWGKRAEQVGELDAGALVLVEGKLRRVRKGEGWETVVSGFECQTLTLPAHAGAAAEGRNN
jgi:hypothetical protein